MSDSIIELYCSPDHLIQAILSRLCQSFATCDRVEFPNTFPQSDQAIREPTEVLPFVIGEPGISIAAAR